MMDTKSTFIELASVMHKNINDYYSRISLAKYYENNKNTTKNAGLPWNWMCKIGLKDNSFAVRMTSFGILGYQPTEKNKNVYRILMSYDQFLIDKMGPVVHLVNDRFQNPAN